METTSIRNLHRNYARPVEPSGFWQVCRASNAEQAELDAAFAKVWASKQAQHGDNLSTVLG